MAKKLAQNASKCPKMAKNGHSFKTGWQDGWDGHLILHSMDHRFYTTKSYLNRHICEAQWQKNGSKRLKMAKNGIFFKTGWHDGWFWLSYIVSHGPWVLQCKKVPKQTHIWVTAAKQLHQNPKKSKKWPKKGIF